MTADIVSLAAHRDVVAARRIVARREWLARLAPGDRVRIEGQPGVWIVSGPVHPTRLYLHLAHTAVMTYRRPDEVWPAHDQEAQAR